MGAPQPFQGHRSYNAYAVSLAIGNYEGLYTFAIECMRKAKGNPHRAARAFMRSYGGERTPEGDGVFNLLCVTEAMREYVEDYQG